MHTTFNGIEFQLHSLDAMAKTSALSVRLPDEVKEAIDKAARDDDRSTASYVERLIVAHLKDKGYLPK